MWYCHGFNKTCRQITEYPEIDFELIGSSYYCPLCANKYWEWRNRYPNDLRSGKEILDPPAGFKR